MGVVFAATFEAAFDAFAGGDESTAGFATFGGEAAAALLLGGGALACGASAELFFAPDFGALAFGGRVMPEFFDLAAFGPTL